MTTTTLRGGMIVRILSPHDARLRTPGAGKRYRLEGDGALFALRDSEGTIRFRRLAAELDRMRGNGRLVVEQEGDSMDPNACLAEISRLANATDSYDKRRRAELCRALQGWLARGGFQPDWKHHPEGLRYFAEHNADRGQADLWCAEFLREGS